MANRFPLSGRRVLNESDKLHAMGYRELPPPAPLAEHVMCLWTREGRGRRVLPDGCVDLVWTGSRLLFAGPATRAVIPDVSAAETKLGLRFRTGAAALALGLPAAELRDQSVPVEDVWGRAGRDLSERVGEAGRADDRLRMLVTATGASLSDAPAPDRLVRAAVRELARPRTRLAALCRSLGISERHLRRRIEEAVGYPPRTLSRVLRLQHFLMLAERDGDDLARLAAEAGYADQSHLTRECSELCGVPAGALLAAGAVPAGERLA